MANRKIGGPYHPVVGEYNLLEETTFRPRIPLNRFRRLMAFVRYFIKVFLLNPCAAIRSFDVSKYGKSARNGELIISIYPYLKIRKPDYIHCHFGTNGMIAEKVTSALKWPVPLFVSFHGFDTVPYKARQTDYVRLFKNASHIFTNSNFLKSKVEALGCDTQKISIIPVGIWNNKLLENRSRNSDKFMFLTIGRLIEVKGIAYSLQALKLFREENPEADFEYIIIGDGELREELKALTKRLLLNDCVFFSGGVTADVVNNYLGKATVFILTGITTGDGRAETQGLVYQEAARHGLPLIASDAGGVSEYVRDGITGLIAREKDVIDIKEKIKMLYFDAELRERMGKAAEVYAKANFDQMKLTQKMIEIYEHYQKN